MAGCLFLFLAVFFSFNSISVSASCTDSEPISKVHIVGLLEIHTSAQCNLNEPPPAFGLSLALAAEYILDLVNSSGADIAVPGVEYEFKLEDICLNRSLATRTAAVNIPETLWTEQNICFNPQPVEEQQDSLLLGFVGPTYSSNAKYVAEFLNNTHIPVISPAATLAELGDPTLYNSFLRTVTSDSKQSKAMVEAALKLEWSYVLLLHVNDDYGRKGAKAIQAYGKAKGICFSNVIEIDVVPANPRQHYEEIGRMIKNDTAKGILYFGFLLPVTAIIESYTHLAGRSLDAGKTILASDGVGVSTEILETLRSSDGKIEFITLSPFNQVNTLKDYIQKRIDGTKKGRPETTALIRDFVESCSERYQCSNDILTDATVSTQPTIEAVVALLHSFKEVHSEICNNVSGICSELSNSPAFYSSMLQSLLSKNEQITIGEVVVSVKFDELGELDSSKSVPAYTLNAAVKGFGNAWQFTEVGQYAHNGTWSYTNENLITPYYGSRCLSNCEFCYKPTVPYLYRRKENSRYIIAGTGITSEELNGHECGQAIQQHGFIMMEVFYYTVKQIEDITGIQFSTLFIDTCYADLATHALMNEIFREVDKAYLKDIIGKEWSIKLTDFVVFLSGSSSGVALALQTYLDAYNIPQISYRATTVWLSDPLRYPWFLRNVPSDEQQAKAMIEIVNQNGWKEIGLITSDSVYGQTGGLSVEKFASDNDICISYQAKATNSREQLRDLAIDIREKAENDKFPRVVIIFAENLFIANLLEQIGLHDQKWSVRGNILIGSETWSTLQSVIKDAKHLVYGSLTFSFSNSTYSWTNDGTNYFQKYLDTQTPANNQDNHLFLRFWQKYFSCYLPNVSLESAAKKCDSSLSLAYTETVSSRLDYEDPSSKHLVLSGLSVAYAILEAARVDRMCTNIGGDLDCAKLFDTTAGRKMLFQYMKQTKVPQNVNSTTRTYLPFTEDGEGKANYDVYNIIKTIDGRGETATYNPTYIIDDGKLQRKVKPQFYIDGVVSTEYSECSRDCTCFNSLNKRDNVILPGYSTECNSNYPLPLLIVIFLALILLLIICIVHIVVQRRRHATLTKMLSHDIPLSPTPVPPTPPARNGNSLISEKNLLQTTSSSLSRNHSYIEPTSVSNSMTLAVKGGLQRSHQPKSAYRPSFSLTQSDGEHFESLDHYSSPDQHLTPSGATIETTPEESLTLTSTVINTELKAQPLSENISDKPIASDNLGHSSLSVKT